MKLFRQGRKHEGCPLGQDTLEVEGVPVAIYNPLLPDIGEFLISKKSPDATTGSPVPVNVVLAPELVVQATLSEDTAP